MQVYSIRYCSLDMLEFPIRDWALLCLSQLIAGYPSQLFMTLFVKDKICLSAVTDNDNYE